MHAQINLGFIMYFFFFFLQMPKSLDNVVLFLI